MFIHSKQQKTIKTTDNVLSWCIEFGLEFSYICLINNVKYIQVYLIVIIGIFSQQHIIKHHGFIFYNLRHFSSFRKQSIP